MTTKQTTFASLPRGQLVLLTIALSMAVLLNSLDLSVANVAIPTISGNLGVSSNRGTWIITAFAAARAVSIPLSGWLAARVGEVRLFIIVTLLFTVFSVLCGLSFTFPMLVVFRALQGAAAGPTLPLSQSLLLANFPRNRHGFANGVWAMTIVVGPVAGPILGGWITDHISWEWIFFINVPIGIFSAIVIWYLLRARETETRKTPFDFVGLGLLVVGVGALQTVMDRGNEDAWFQSNFIVLLSIVTVVAFIFFIVWELTDEHPAVDLSLFRERNFTVATIAISFAFMAYFGGVVVFPLWLQNFNGYTAVWAGLALSSLGIMAFFASPIVGRLTDRVDPRILVTVGMLIFAVVSFNKASLNTHATFMQFFLTRLPWGLGSACFIVPLFTLSVSDLPANRVASASGLFNFMRLLALACGTALSQTLWDRRSNLHEHHLAAQLTPFSEPVRHWLHSLHEQGLTQAQSLAVMARETKNQAFMLGLNDAFWLSGCLFLVLTVLIWFARPRRNH